MTQIIPYPDHYQSKNRLPQIVLSKDYCASLALAFALALEFVIPFIECIKRLT
jgi:hypothetical protein